MILRGFLLLGLAGAVVGCASLAAEGPGRLPISPTADQGRRLVQRSCAGCHATGASASPYRAAPPLWRVPRGYRPEDLQQVLARTPGHDPQAMPGIVLTREEAGAVIAYVDALARADRKTRRRLGVGSCFTNKPC